MAIPTMALVPVLCLYSVFTDHCRLTDHARPDVAGVGHLPGKGKGGGPVPYLPCQWRGCPHEPKDTTYVVMIANPVVSFFGNPLKQFQALLSFKVPESPLCLISDVRNKYYMSGVKTLEISILLDLDGISSTCGSSVISFNNNLIGSFMCVNCSETW